MSVPNDAVLRVTTKMTGVNGQLIENVYHLHTFFQSPQDEADVANAIGGWLNTAFDYIYTNISENVLPQSFLVQIVEFLNGQWTVTGTVGDFTWVLTHAFSSASDALSDGAAALIRFPTSVPKHVGRKFLYGLTENMAGNSQIVSGVVTNLANWAATILSNPVIDGLNYMHSGIVNGKADQFLQFASAVAEAVIAYQRRRKQGVGV